VTRVESSGPVRVSFVTLGCPKNEVDSDRMKASLLACGMPVVEDLDDADVVVLNTCGFIRDAVEEGVEVALDLAGWRDADPGRRLIVAGCLVSRYGDELKDSLTEADAFLSVADECELPALIARMSLGTDMAVCVQPDVVRTPAAGPSAYLQISDGCFRACAYCTIPSIRGAYRSRPLPEILDEARFLISTGAKEIILIGQDTSAWGRDLPGTETLADVLGALAGLEGLRWLRVMYVQPDGVTDELLAAMSAHPTVCHYLDMPLQHASASVLRSMRRSGSGAEYLALIGRVRRAMPDVVLRTTLIAGFPGETRADVDELIGFIEEADLDYVGVFPYSPEAGTEAATLPGLPSKRTRVARAQRVRDAADRVGTAKVIRLIGETLEVLSEGVDEEGVPVGRWRGQAPEVDGVMLLGRQIPVGEFAQVRVTDTLGYDVEAEVL